MRIECNNDLKFSIYILKYVSVFVFKYGYYKG